MSMPRRMLCMFMLALCSLSADSLRRFGDRDSPYLLRTNDVVDVGYRYTPEYDQVVTVPPDGFVNLRIVGVVRFAGRTIDDIQKEVKKKAAAQLRDPEISLTLKDFERPYFVVGGQVASPGRYNMPGKVSALQAIATAGGFNRRSKHSQVILFRSVNDDLYQTRVLNMKALLKKPQSEENVMLHSGDMLLVPTNRLSKIERFVHLTNFAVFWEPTGKR